MVTCVHIASILSEQWLGSDGRQTGVAFQTASILSELLYAGARVNASSFVSCSNLVGTAEEKRVIFVGGRRGWGDGRDI